MHKKSFENQEKCDEVESVTQVTQPAFKKVARLQHRQQKQALRCIELITSTY